MADSSPFHGYLAIYLFPLIYPPYAVEEPWYSASDREKVFRTLPPENYNDKPSILKCIYELQELQAWTEQR